MKLNAAAVFILSFVFVISFGGVAFALDGIDLSEPAEAVEEGACSRLVQIKYPFISCSNGEIGQSSQDETWENSRHIQIMSDWTEGDGAWGPELNPI